MAKIPRFIWCQSRVNYPQEGVSQIKVRKSTVKNFLDSVHDELVSAVHNGYAIAIGCKVLQVVRKSRVILVLYVQHVVLR